MGRWTSCCLAWSLAVLVLLACGATADEDVCGRITTVLDTTIRTLTWESNDNLVLYIVTQNSTLYKSIDEGASWTNEMQYLEHSLEPVAQLDGLRGINRVISTSDDSRSYILGWGDSFWTCADRSHHYEHHFVYELSDQLQPGKHRLTAIVPHGSQPERALILVREWDCLFFLSSCDQLLFVTNDFGATATFISSHVLQASWGGRDDSIFFVGVPEEYRDGRSLNFYSNEEKSVFHTMDYGKTYEHVIPRAPVFLYSLGFLYVGVVDQNGYYMNLWVSTADGHNITRAVFNDDLVEDAYTILDTTEGATFVNVQHNDPRWGNLYVSDSFNQEFTLSLPKNRRRYGDVDFQRIEGLEGIYLANYYDLPDVVLDDGVPYDLQERRLKTVITVDKGAQWTTLPVPDSIPCPDIECSLHLFGNSQSSRVYSRASAVGIVLATGNVGSYQQLRADDVGTYFSRDGGVSWELIKKGQHVYAFGDHGAIMLMASDQQATTEYIFSWNEGLTWTNCSFPELSPVQVTSIVSEPKATSQRFLIYGTRSIPGSFGTYGVVIQVDFESLHERQCTGADRAGEADSDYELWVPSNHHKCLLGERVEYVRRKRDRECYNGLSYESKKFLATCACSDEDYICDGDCFQYEPASNECVNSCENTPRDPTLLPNPCVDTWVKPSGYRLVPGTKCDTTRGVRLLPEVLPCSNDSESDSHHSELSLLVLLALLVVFAIVLLVGLAGGGVYLYRTNERFREVVEPWLPGGGNSFSSMYSRLSRGGTHDDDDDDDDRAFGLMDDEDFSQPSSHASSAVGDIEAPQRISSLPPPTAAAADTDIPALSAPSTTGKDKNVLGSTLINF